MGEKVGGIRASVRACARGGGVKVGGGVGWCWFVW